MKPVLAALALVLIGCGAATPAARPPPERTPAVAEGPATPPPLPPPDPGAVVPPVIAASAAPALEDVPPGPRLLVSTRAVWLDDGTSPPTLAMTLAAGLSTPEQRDGGASGLVLVPLREALVRFGPFGPRVLVVTGDVPLRTLAEVVATLGAAGSNVARLVVKAGDRVGAVRIGIPGQTADGRLVLNLTEVNPMARAMPRAEVVTIEEDSPLVTIAVSASGHVVARRGVVFAPGCRGSRAADTAGPTVAVRGASHDYDALVGCLRTLRASTPAPRLVTVTADTDVPLASVLSTLAMVRADATGPLFDHVVLSAGAR